MEQWLLAVSGSQLAGSPLPSLNNSHDPVPHQPPHTHLSQEEEGDSPVGIDPKVLVMTFLGHPLKHSG